MSPSTDSHSHGIWVSYALTMDRHVQGPEKQTHGASRNRLSPAAFSASRRLLWIWNCDARRNCYEVQCSTIGWLPGCPVSQVAIGQASALSSGRSAAFPRFLSTQEKRLPYSALRIAYCVFCVWECVARHLAATETPCNRNSYPSCPRSAAMIPGVFDI